jgi:uncharacterized protein DUF4168
MTATYMVIAQPRPPPREFRKSSPDEENAFFLDSVTENIGNVSCQRRLRTMRKRITGILPLTMVAGLVSLLCAPAINAQSQRQPPAAEQAAQSSPPRKEINDQELQAFAKAYVGIEKVKESHTTSLKNVQDPQQIRKLQQEADSQIDKTLKTQGFTNESYQQTLTAVTSNNKLTKKAFDLIKKERTS